MKMYSVYDSQLKLYSKPFYARNAGEALRSFTQAVNDENVFKRHAAAVTLFEVGEFNEESSKISAYDAMINLGNGIEFVEKKNANQDSLFAIPPSTPDN